MRTVTFLLLLATSVVAQAPPQQQHQQQPHSTQPGKMRSFRGTPGDINLITAEMKAQEKAWNDRDAAGYVVDFIDAMQFTDLAGTVISGRNPFRDRLQQMFRTHFKGAHLRYEIREIRFVRPRVVVCDIDAEITNYKSLPPGATTRLGRPLRTRLKYILTKEARSWVIITGQETERREKDQK
ncbi:MAG: SgcJ/EcaC family oxidoreductase [Acidobacteriia bacterium]|nr:SgcJ/EcaC family oxidoreductase [Terriglobia bacterium]